jgi:hypothetical protein
MILVLYPSEVIRYSLLLNQFSGTLQGGTLGAAGAPSAAAPLVIMPTAGPDEETAPPSPSSAIKLAYSAVESRLGRSGCTSDSGRSTELVAWRSVSLEAIPCHVAGCPKRGDNIN